MPPELFEQDEELLSTEAKERMRESYSCNFKVDPAIIDELAAAIILEDFPAQQQA